MSNYVDLKDTSEEIKQLFEFEIRDLETEPYTESSFHLSVKKDVDEVFSEHVGPGYKKLDDLSLAMAGCLAHIINRDIYKFTYVYLVWTFLYDDMLEKRDKVFIVKWMKKLEARYADEDTYLDHIFNYFVTGWKTYLPEDMIDKAVKDIIGCTALFESKGSVDQIICSIEKQKQILNYDHYFEIRLLDIGCLGGITWIEVSLGENLIDIRKNEPVNELLKLFDYNVGLGLVLVNDIYSFKKEINQNRFKYNYVYIKMKNESLTVQQSVDAIVGEIKEFFHLMYLYREKLKEFKIPALTKYVEVMFRVVHKAHYWSTVCERYNKLD